MNTKQLSLVASILLSGLGCSTLPRPEVSYLGDFANRRVAIASGPALVQISTAGSGTATFYLADDAGDGSTTCPNPGAEKADFIKALNDDDYAADLPVPRGKRVCATIDSPALIMDWLAEDYSTSGRASSLPETPAPSPDAGSRGVLFAKR